MILDQLAAEVAQLSRRPLPQEVLHHAKRAVLDWFACVFPGSTMAPTPQLVAAQCDELGVGRSTVLGYGQTAFPATAAWINGSAAHAAEFDDIFRDAVYHPGCPTVAAALALAQDRHASGEALLRSVIAGYEISTRVGAAVQPAHYRFFHTTGTAGCLGGAAAGALLVAPGSAQVALHAMANASTFASGLQQAFRSDAMTKALHGGHAAMVGVQAAQGASAGVTGVRDMLEGAAGFGAALGGSARWERATEGLGQRYNIMAITQKNHGCCGHTFAAIDAALVLVQQYALSAQDIAAIRIQTYQVALDVTANATPVGAFEARFSLPYVVCHAIVHGSVRLAAFEPERLNDLRVRRLMTQVELQADPALSAAFPGQRAAKVEFVLHDGRRLSHFAPYRRGDPESPLSDQELSDKFMELVAPVCGSPAAKTLLAQCWQLEHLTVDELELPSFASSSVSGQPA
ncbi:MAG: MmgE/PrpD family protein [Burkholderiaceae bacterium]